MMLRVMDFNKKKKRRVFIVKKSLVSHSQREFLYRKNVSFARTPLAFHVWNPQKNQIFFRNFIHPRKNSLNRVAKREWNSRKRMWKILKIKFYSNATIIEFYISSKSSNLNCFFSLIHQTNDKFPCSFYFFYLIKLEWDQGWSWMCIKSDELMRENIWKHFITESNLIMLM